MNAEHRIHGDEVAAIDCGTNSIRLLIARPDATGESALAELHREMRIVRLGEDVDATGEFSPGALERTFTAVDDYAAVIRRLLGQAPAERTRFVATSASRDVRNRDEFSAGIQARLGVAPDVVDGSAEAALSFAGAASALPDHIRQRLSDQTGSDTAAVLVVDLGGGSTEFVVGTVSLSNTTPARVSSSVSMNMGCVRFTERHLRSDPPTNTEVSSATAEIDELLDTVAEHIDLSSVDAVVGVAGTVTTVTAAALGLDSYDPQALHAAAVDLPTIDDAAANLLGATREDRAALPYMHPGRVDVIGAGALIWSRILQRVHTETGEQVNGAVTSEQDILDGIALSLMERER